MPRSRDLDRLKKFEPQREGSQISSTKSHLISYKEGSRWPSREPIADGQLSIKGPLNTIHRFKAMCKADRRTYADMLEILMNSLEKNSDV